MKEQVKKGRRRNLLAKIHIAKKELGLDDDAWRFYLNGLTDKTSCADMTMEELATVLNDLLKKGWSVKKRAKFRPHGTEDRDPLLRKIYMLLKEERRTWRYADGMARRMFGVERVQWLEPMQLHKVVTALMYDKKRKERKEARNG